ncbi:amidohydrolase family protein [Microbacterium sp. cx-55]|uniref:metal-dependent hydrolase family protein n=1 Tax=unclassified Microbacterium TaxID=2609290 RepID=UPI001CBB1D11|nr:MULTISPECIES: amidohydrolase family protein [unclassified Microbacterium]MBZ4487463.1 amidohydrolase family protein [Microbacterium sp. cx-55]MCC4908406.1 amidohydrolase family protein [Microbacterium sp. cx-59]UGB35483.1 amidohydrolase family protein [Microbacterium sp. cx-55]
MPASEQHVTGLPVWDGDRDRGTATLSWQGDRITSVQPTAAAPSEFSIIPGLIDTHVHLDASAGAPAGDWMTWPLITPASERSLHVVAHARNAAAAGVTTLRDLSGSDVQFSAARALAAGLIPGPRLLVHGAVGMTAGHGDLFVPPHYPHRPPVADSPDECRKLVRQWARSGADGIKIFTSGGVLSIGDKVGWRNQTRQEIAATVDEAHALGMLVAAHTHTAEGVDIALEFEVDSIEHGTGIEERHWETLLERNLPVAPTLLINDAIADRRIAVSEDAAEKARAVVTERDHNFVGAAAAGIRFVLGTDANGVMVRFGDQLEELRLMKRAFGWTSERALQAGTSDAADAIRLTGTVGRLQPGHGADFVVVRGTPWQNIDDLRTENIVAVVARGELVAGALPA